MNTLPVAIVLSSLILAVSIYYSKDDNEVFFVHDKNSILYLNLDKQENSGKICHIFLYGTGDDVSICSSFVERPIVGEPKAVNSE